jgi:hypothetical protein
MAEPAVLKAYVLYGPEVVAVDDPAPNPDAPIVNDPLLAAL